MTDHEHDFGRYNQLNDFCEVAGCMVSAWEYVKPLPRLRRAAGLALPELAFHYDEQGRYHDAGVASQGCGTCEAFAALREALEESGQR